MRREVAMNRLDFVCAIGDANEDSPGTRLPETGEAAVARDPDAATARYRLLRREEPGAGVAWPPEPPDLGANPPREIVEILRTQGHGPRERQLLPAGRFSNEPAAEWQCRLANSPTTADSIRERSRTVEVRLRRSCAGWAQPPGSREFYEAVRARAPNARQKAILDAWAREATWTEVLHGWTEHAYTLYELVAALHRAGLSRCLCAATLNKWASRPATEECTSTRG